MPYSRPLKSYVRTPFTNVRRLLVMNCYQLSLPLINYTCHRSTIPITDQQSLTMITCPLPVTEMPTSRDLNFSKTKIIELPHPPKKKAMIPPPHQFDPHTPKQTYSVKKKRRFPKSSEDGKVDSKSNRGLPEISGVVPENQKGF